MKEDDRRCLEEIYTEERDEDVNEDTENCKLHYKTSGSTGDKKSNKHYKIIGKQHKPINHSYK